MSSPLRPIERLKPLLGTFVRIRVEGVATSKAFDAIDEAFSCIAEIHRLMSFHEPASELSVLNREAWRAPVKVHPHTRAVLEKALEIARASNGLFDPTIAPWLVQGRLLPAPAAAMPDGNATWEDILLSPDGWVRFARPLWVDLGGIAKGYAVDCASAVLERYRPVQGCVDAGGDLRLVGPMPGRVLIDAAGPGDIPVLELQNAAVASSGSQTVAGRGRVSPHIDTRTGMGCPTDRFVSVIAPRCVEADALTKVAMAAKGDCGPILAQYGAQALLFENARWRSLAEAA